MKDIDILGKVVCINNSNGSYINSLIIGKIYGIYEKRYLGDTLIGYLVKSDNIKCVYSIEYFETIEENRDRKLEELGI